MPSAEYWPWTPWLPGGAGVAALIPVLARVGGLVWTAPAWGTAGIGLRFRVVMTCLLTFALAPAIGPELSTGRGGGAVAEWGAGAGAGRLVAAEVAVGAAMGMTAALVLAAARLAGEVVGAQAGLSPASALDPDAAASMTPAGHLYGLVALAAFLALDGPLTLVGALIESYRVVPAGGPGLSLELADRAFGQVGQAMGLALKAAAPAGLALLLAGVALGLIARAGSALSLWTLSLPARTLIGLILMLIGLAPLAATMTGAWRVIGDGWLMVAGG